MRKDVMETTRRSRARLFGLLLLTVCLAVSPASAQELEPQMADFDGSEKVDFPDFLLFVQAFGKTEVDDGYESRFDLIPNGHVDFDDFLSFVSVFGQATTTVVEPVLLNAFGSGEGNWRGSPLVVDVTGDETPEIFVSVWNNLRAYAPDGTLLWSIACEGRDYSGAVAGDVDGDGDLEIAFADNKGVIRVVDGNGTLMPGWPQTVRLGPDVRSIACADVDADGADEVIVFSSLTDRGAEPNMYIYEGDGQVREGWPHYYATDPYLGSAYDHAGGFNCNLAVGDLDDDGRLEVVFPQDYGSVSVFKDDGVPVYVHSKFSAHGSGSRVHWGEVRSWLNSTVEREKWGPGSTHFLEFTMSPATIADIDLDGEAEILVVPNLESGTVGPWKGTALGVYNMDRTHQPGFDPMPAVTTAIVGEAIGGPGEPNPVAVAGDIAGDEKLEIVVLHADGTCRAYDYLGNELWSVQVLPDGDYAASEPLLADVTGNGRPDVILLSSRRDPNSSELIVIDGAGRQRVSFDIPLFTLASPTLADVTGDGQPELIVVATYPGDGRIVHIYTWDAVDPQTVIWSTGRGDAGHTGWLRQ